MGPGEIDKVKTALKIASSLPSNGARAIVAPTSLPINESAMASNTTEVATASKLLKFVMRVFHFGAGIAAQVAESWHDRSRETAKSGTTEAVGGKEYYPVVRGFEPVR